MPKPEVISLTREQVPALAEQTANDLATLGFPLTAAQNLADFLSSLHQEQLVTAVALVSVTSEVPGPRLDVYTLSGNPMNLPSDAEGMSRITRLHTAFARSLTEGMGDGDDAQYYGTFIYMIASQRYSSTELLRDDLVRQHGAGYSAGVITVANLTRT